MKAKFIDIYEIEIRGYSSSDRVLMNHFINDFSVGGAIYIGCSGIRDNGKTVSMVLVGSKKANDT